MNSRNSRLEVSKWADKKDRNSHWTSSSSSGEKSEDEQLGSVSSTSPECGKTVVTRAKSTQRNQSMDVDTPVRTQQQQWSVKAEQSTSRSKTRSAHGRNNEMFPEFGPMDDEQDVEVFLDIPERVKNRRAARSKTASKKVKEEIGYLKDEPGCSKREESPSSATTDPIEDEPNTQSLDALIDETLLGNAEANNNFVSEPSKMMTRQTKQVQEIETQQRWNFNKRTRNQQPEAEVQTFAKIPRVSFQNLKDAVEKERSVEKENKFFKHGKGPKERIFPILDQTPIDDANNTTLGVEEPVEKSYSSDQTEILEPLDGSSMEVDSSIGNGDQLDGNNSTVSAEAPVSAETPVVPYSEVTLAALNEQEFERLLRSEFVISSKRGPSRNNPSSTGQDKNNVLTIQNLIRFLDMRGMQRKAAVEHRLFLADWLAKDESFLILMASLIEVRENKYLMQTETLSSLFGRIIENFKARMIMEYVENKRVWEGMLNILA